MDEGKLKIAAAADREIVMTRIFDAPRRLVFECMTKPELLRRWLLGPPGWSMVVCDVDLRVGGAYRYVWRNQKGTEMGMGGVFREIVRPERLVQRSLLTTPGTPATRSTRRSWSRRTAKQRSS